MDSGFVQWRLGSDCKAGKNCHASHDRLSLDWEGEIYSRLFILFILFIQGLTL